MAGLVGVRERVRERGRGVVVRQRITKREDMKLVLSLIKDVFKGRKYM